MVLGAVTTEGGPRFTRRAVLATLPATATLLLTAGWSPARAATIPGTRAARREALFAARNWVSYYQSPAPGSRRDALRAFDYLDIDADEGNFDSRSHAKAVVADLRSDRRLVVSYLNIGAAETFRWYWPFARPFKLDPYAGWPGEYWLDVRQPGWHDAILERVAPVLEAAGVDGFYLDNIDVSSRYGRPAFRTGVVELVRKLRLRFPEMLLIGQSYDMLPYLDRGSDGRRMFEYLDGTSKEEVNGSYAGGYHRIPVAASNRMLAELEAFRDRGLHVAVLDYANRRPDAAYCIRRTTSRGLLPFVSLRELDSTRVWDDAQGPHRPSGLSATRLGTGSGSDLRLEWKPALDDMGVSRYDILRDGKVVGHSNEPRFVDASPPASHATYEVRAWDTGRHASPLSRALEFGRDERARRNAMLEG